MASSRRKPRLEKIARRFPCGIAASGCGSIAACMVSEPTGRWPTRECRGADAPTNTRTAEGLAHRRGSDGDLGSDVPADSLARGVVGAVGHTGHVDSFVVDSFVVESPIGALGVAVTHDAVCGVSFGATVPDYRVESRSDSRLESRADYRLESQAESLPGPMVGHG